MSYPWSAGDNLNASDLNSMFLGSAYGFYCGDGSDGSKAIESSEDIDADNKIYVVKNYTDFTLDAGETLGLTNVPDKGTLLHIRVQGNCVINGKIDLAGDGGAGGASVNDYSASGNDGYPGSFSLNPNISFLSYTKVFDQTAEYYTEFNFGHEGRKGGTGRRSTAGSKNAGGGGGGGGYADGTNGTAGDAWESCGWAGSGGKKQIGVETGILEHPSYRILVACCGGGGGSGGCKEGDTDTSGAGGNGGGGLIIEVGGNLTFGAASEIDLSGTNAAASAGSAGGSGGGGGGIGQIIYGGTLTDNGLTKTVSGGNATDSAGDGGDGGAGADGKIELIKHE
jgi:hypothetical protein